MIELVSNKRGKITALCRTYGMRRLELFGSATGLSFDPETSDLDFIVDVGEYERGVAKRYVAFCNALQQLMDLPVDVMTNQPIQNPYLRASVNASRMVVYDASDSEALA